MLLPLPVWLPADRVLGVPLCIFEMLLVPPFCRALKLLPEPVWVDVITLLSPVWLALADRNAPFWPRVIVLPVPAPWPKIARLPSIAEPVLVCVTVTEANEPPCEPETEFDAP